MRLRVRYSEDYKRCPCTILGYSPHEKQMRALCAARNSTLAAAYPRREEERIRKSRKVKLTTEERAQQMMVNKRIHPGNATQSAVVEVANPQQPNVPPSQNIVPARHLVPRESSKTAIFLSLRSGTGLFQAPPSSSAPSEPPVKRNPARGRVPTTKLREAKALLDAAAEKRKQLKRYASQSPGKSSRRGCSAIPEVRGQENGDFRSGNSRAPSVGETQKSIGKDASAPQRPPSSPPLAEPRVDRGEPPKNLDRESPVFSTGQDPDNSMDLSPLSSPSKHQASKSLGRDEVLSNSDGAAFSGSKNLNVAEALYMAKLSKEDRITLKGSSKEQLISAIARLGHSVKEDQQRLQAWRKHMALNFPHEMKDKAGKLFVPEIPWTFIDANHAKGERIRLTPHPSQSDIWVYEKYMKRAQRKATSARDYIQNGFWDTVIMVPDRVQIIEQKPDGV